MFSPANLVNQIITKNNPQFSLDGMLNPTFQNQGTANVYINGLLIQPGDSYACNVPGVEFKNTIPIVFEQDSTKSRILYVGYASLIK